MSAFYANQKERTELSNLSVKVFGTRSKWQYFVKERGYTIDAIKEQMLLLAKEIDKQVEEIKNGERSKPTDFKRPNRAIRRKLNIR